MGKLIWLYNERYISNWWYACRETLIKQRLNELDILKLFIKWLVDNNKISPFEIDRKIIDSWWLYHWKETTINRVWNNLDKVLLMLLAIQDNPINFLIQLLK